jgi:pyrroloquinoline-quinone synthase
VHSLIDLLNARIEAKHLLKHPFYIAWTNGELRLVDLQLYAKRYFAHVLAFPTYLSEMHCRCQDTEVRKVIARNLAEEEGRDESHPDLWLQFAAGLGLHSGSTLDGQSNERMRDLIATYHDVARMDTGLAAAGLYCYEKQVPAVSASKIAGLRKHYGIRNRAAVRYFKVHETADVRHAAEWEAVLDWIMPDKGPALEVADRALDVLWGALDGIYEECQEAAA